MRNTKSLKEGIESLIFATPVRLDGKDFAIELSFNKCLKILKYLKNIRMTFEKIDPSEFAEIIDEANIVSMCTNRGGGRTPYIRKNELQSFGRNTSGNRVG